MHDRITALFLFLGAVIPLILTFGLVYYAPHLYDDGIQTAAPWIQAMREHVVQLHDVRALNAFDVSLGGGALFSMYLGLVVGRFLNVVQKALEHWLGKIQRAQPQSS